MCNKYKHKPINIVFEASGAGKTSSLNSLLFSYLLQRHIPQSVRTTLV